MKACSLVISNNICGDVYMCHSWTDSLSALHLLQSGEASRKKKKIKGSFPNNSPSLPISKHNPQNFIRACNVFNFI